MFTQKMIESFKDGDQGLGLLVLSKFGREIVDFDKRTGNRILYWSIVTETRSVGEPLPPPEWLTISLVV